MLVVRAGPRGEQTVSALAALSPQPAPDIANSGLSACFFVCSSKVSLDMEGWP